MQTSAQIVLDLGTGTGVATLLAESRVGKGRGAVIGIDISEKMLEIAMEEATKLGLLNLTFKKMDVTFLKFPDKSLDAVVSNLSFPTHYFSSATSKAFRVLEKGGVFCF